MQPRSDIESGQHGRTCGARGWSSGAQPLNLGQDRMVRIKELAEMIATCGGISVTRRHVPGPQGVRGRNSDNTRLRQALGWPRVTFEDGLARTYAWVEQQVIASAALNGAAELTHAG
jgi:nucleoside-diphosphate-sugar epimerase